MRSTSNRSAKLLAQILATLGVTSAISAVACTKGVVSPDNAPDAIKECPDDKGHYAEWPDGKQPDMMAGVNDVCLPKPADGKSCSAYTSSCVLSRFRCGVSTGGTQVLDTLPTKNPEVCCFKVKGACAIGRPFVVDGLARLAELTSGTGWSSATTTNPDLHALDIPTTEEERVALADVWSLDALTEHASVASFAQLILELLALGAPAHLVRGAQEAMADEIRHAEHAFALASFYAGTPLAPTALDTNLHSAPNANVRVGAAARLDLADFAARTASEACIAETIASLILHAAADAATNRVLADLLRTTAEEESRHALLGYEIVRWAIAKGGDEARTRVSSVFADASAHVGFGAVPPAEKDLRRHGILSRADRQSIAARALTELIEPIRMSLASHEGFAQHPTPQQRLQCS
jgi:hypothetical protein